MISRNNEDMRKRNAAVNIMFVCESTRCYIFKNVFDETLVYIYKYNKIY